uniref:Amino acid permease/ SLC12A domain-containing protein n=1 Tax=Arcella intermedia TaxID=1963864 RepID=A0A6B2L2T4_9EUKA
MPSNEGAFVWIHTAFGKRVSFITSIIYWFSYSVDTALYPALFYAYFKTFDEELFSTTPFQISIPLCATVIITVLNFLGIEIIGTLSIFLLGIQLTPVFIIFFWSLSTGRVSPSDWIKLPPGDQLSFDNFKRIALCMQVMIWSYSGYDSVGCIVEQLSNSKKNLRRCLIGACSLATFTYFTVIVGSIGIDKEYGKWEEGSLAKMGEQLAGPWLKYFIIVSAMTASLGTFNALMFPTSQQLKALGGPDYLDIPLLTYTHPRFNTPWVAIGINGVICGLAGALPFIFLIQLNNIFYGILIIFICLSAVRLRYSEIGKQLERPFKVAEANGMVVLIVIWPILICIYLIIDSIVSDWRLGVVAVAVLVLLVGVFFGCSIRRKNKEKAEEDEELVDEEMDDVTKAEISSNALLKKLRSFDDDL